MFLISNGRVLHMTYYTQIRLGPLATTNTAIQWRIAQRFPESLLGLPTWRMLLR